MNKLDAAKDFVRKIYPDLAEGIVERTAIRVIAALKLSRPNALSNGERK